jgi:uncharacterized protein
MDYSSTFKLLHRAILRREQVTLTYHGQRREICPYILGHTAGKEALLAFQFGGGSARGGTVRGAWRCFYLAEVENPEAREGPWYGSAAHRTKQRCVEDVYIDVNTEVPNQPGRKSNISVIR